jgi:hypothetical protein
LSSGFHACYASALPLEPISQPFTTFSYLLFSPALDAHS